MPENKRLDIIKGAILLEYRGKALYESVVKTTKIDSIKELFSFLVKEEEKHIEILEKQFSKVNKNEDFDLGNFVLNDFETSNKILSKKIVNEVFGAGYEASIIAAALEFEKNAVEFYSKHETSTENKEEKKLYKWLADWEKTHMIMLAELDNEIKEQIWYDNKFWPLD